MSEGLGEEHLWFGPMLGRAEEHGPRAGIPARLQAGLGLVCCMLAASGLQDVLGCGEKYARVATAEALGALAPLAPVGALLHALAEDPYWDVRAAAAQSLGALGERVAARQLLVLLCLERDGSVREAVVVALGRVGGPVPVEELIVLLRDDVCWMVREAAARVLGTLGGDAPVAPLLLALRRDEDECVRAAAARALGRALKQGVRGDLVAALDDQAAEVRAAAAWALQQLDAVPG